MPGDVEALAIVSLGVSFQHSPRGGHMTEVARLSSRGSEALILLLLFFFVFKLAMPRKIVNVNEHDQGHDNVNHNDDDNENR